MKYIVTLNGKKYEVDVERVSDSISTNLSSNGVRQSDSQSENTRMVESTSDGIKNVVAPMPGTILDVKVSVGDKVKVGDVLLILEAMKMENEISSETNGVVKAVGVSKGDKVSSNDFLIEIE